ncbi:hypothetical protein BKA61DRAFT_487619, partial [Leptodontidium sp. MPI-SDFR-AT-0119]
WYHVVSYYSQRALTVPTDCLPALSALASILHSHAREDRYLAGIWQHDLPRGLLWTCSSGSIDHGLQAGPYVAPSWSWACAPAGMAVHYAWMTLMTRIDLAPWQPVLRICSVEYVLKGKNLYGEVSVARLELQGLVAEVRCHKDNVYADIHGSGVEGKTPLTLSFDSGKAPVNVRAVEILAVLTLGYRAETLCLIIEPTGGATYSLVRQYQRVGVARIDSDVLKHHGINKIVYLV